MRSSWAKGSHSFLQPRNKNEISRLIRVIAKKYFVQVYQLAIAGNHLHLVIRISSRRQHYKTFVRVLSSQIASHVMRKQSFAVFKRFALADKRGDPPNSVTDAGLGDHPGLMEQQGLEQQFWQFRPWTRVMHWGRDFTGCCRYLTRNTLEALGFIEYKPRKDRYSKWLPVTAQLARLE